MEKGSQKENSIMEFLQKTKSQIADLSKRAANATKSGFDNTTSAIQTKVVETKERSRRKKKQKLNLSNQKSKKKDTSIRLLQ